MRNPKNAATDVLEELDLASNVQEFTEEDPAIGGRWLVTFTSQISDDTMRLEVEVLENGGTPAVCVLHRRNCPRSLMTRIMGRFTERLTNPPAPPSSPPGGGN